MKKLTAAEAAARYCTKADRQGKCKVSIEVGDRFNPAIQKIEDEVGALFPDAPDGFVSYHVAEYVIKQAIHRMLLNGVPLQQVTIVFARAIGAEQVDMVRVGQQATAKPEQTH